MVLTVKPPQLIILKYLSKRGNEESFGRIKNDLFSQIKNFQLIFDSLVSDKFIERSCATVSLNQKSIEYITAYDNFGSEHIFEHEPDLAILKFLYEIDSPIALRWFPKIIQDTAPSYNKSNSDEGYNLNDYIVYHSSIKTYVANVKENFTLNSFGKSYYESLIQKQTQTSHKESFEIKNRILQNELNKVQLKLGTSQLEVSELQKKDFRNKALYSILSFIGGVITARLDDILHFLKTLLLHK